MSSIALSPAAASRLVVNHWLVAVIVVLPTFMEILDTTIANVALRYIAGGLAAPQSDADWVITAYLAANAIVLPITDRQTEYARSVRQQLDAAGIRTTVDERNEKVNLKIREAQLQKIPYMLVVGDREQENGQVAVRNRKHGDQGAKPLADFIAEIRALIQSKAVSE